ncbi:Hypothetical_protein [Hexamita inflata]|uniref:Hypothetical_protein n=1 Tax=Hexamita inflata TaxID=28002 RepID=A0AA86P2F5_9EUKA|nr:Hypothetical protein HINF_LOCUS17423 [Hexamita inflata]
MVRRRWIPVQIGSTKQPRYAPGCLYPSRWLPWMRRCAQRTQVYLKLMIMIFLEHLNLFVLFFFQQTNISFKFKFFAHELFDRFLFFFVQLTQSDYFCFKFWLRFNLRAGGRSVKGDLGVKYSFKILVLIQKLVALTLNGDQLQISWNLGKSVCKEGKVRVQTGDGVGIVVNLSELEYCKLELRKFVEPVQRDIVKVIRYQLDCSIITDCWCSFCVYFDIFSFRSF